MYLPSFLRRTYFAIGELLTTAFAVDSAESEIEFRVLLQSKQDDFLTPRLVACEVPTRMSSQARHPASISCQTTCVFLTAVAAQTVILDSVARTPRPPNVTAVLHFSHVLLRMCALYLFDFSFDRGHNRESHSPSMVGKRLPQLTFPTLNGAITPNLLRE